MKRSIGILSLVVAWCLWNPAATQATVTSSVSQNNQTERHDVNHDKYFEEKVIRSYANQRSHGGQSPSARRQGHWTKTNGVKNLHPLAPDELAELAGDSNKGTIARIKRIEKRKGVEASAESSVTVKWYEKIRDDAHIDIYVSGGGFRGGINPLIHNYIMISSSGYLQRLYETEVEGKVKTEAMIDRETLLDFVKWVAENGFFEMDRKYECADDDKQCQSRLKQYPKPIPMKLVIAVGPYRNVVSIPMYAPHLQDDLIEYPKEIRKIVEAIYDFASL